MDPDVASALRKHFRSHNRRAWFLAWAALLAAASVWGLLYLGMSWLVLLFLSVLRGVNAPIGIDFLPAFLILIVSCLALDWLVRDVLGYDSDRVGKFAWWKVLLDLVLLPVTLTYAIPNNLSALVHPREDDLAAAWHLLRRLLEENKISLQQLPLEIPDLDQLETVQYLLGITGLTDTDNYGGTWWLHLKDDRSRSFVRRLEKHEAPELE